MLFSCCRRPIVSRRRGCPFGAVDYFPARDTVEDMPNCNALGLIVGSSEKWYTTILMDEVLRRFGIVGVGHNLVSHVGELVEGRIADWTVERLDSAAIG